MMVEKTRKDRENKKHAQKKLMDSPPQHVLHRLGQPSPLIKNLDTKLYNGGISKFDSRGQLIKIDQDKELGANYDRHTEKEKCIAALYKKYSTVWNKRGVAEGIALAENIHVTTVLRYIRNYPKGLRIK